jgi:hypothetical protein
MKREADETMDERLAKIGERTATLRARGGYNDRVMQAVQAARGGLFDDLWRAARAIMPVAVVAATLALGWAVHTDRAADLALASTFDVVEVEW